MERRKYMEWQWCGFENIGLASSFVVWLEKNNIQVSRDIDEHYGIFRVFYRPIGKEQKYKCNKEIERRIQLGLA